MTKINVRQTKRSEGTFKHKIVILKIRDWLAFFFTIAGFCLSLPESVHLNVQVRYNVEIEICNYISEVGNPQRNLRYYFSNPEDDVEHMRRIILTNKNLHIEWVDLNQTELPIKISENKIVKRLIKLVIS